MINSQLVIGKQMKFSKLTAAIITTIAMSASAQTYLGNLTANPYLPPAPPQPSGTFNNPYGNSSNSPQLYDSQGQFRGNLNSNQYDPNSVANPYGRYGSQYSADSINNPYGAGSQYRSDSPNNPYGTGMKIYGR
jgi:hypothetical protein